MNYYYQYNYNPYYYQQPYVQPSPVFWGPADPGYVEKRRLQRAGNSIGGGLLMLFGLPSLLATVISYLSVINEDIEIFLYSPHGMWIYQILASALVMIIPFWLSTLFYRQKLTEAVMFSKPEKGSGTISLIFAGLGACVVANLMASFIEAVFSYEQSTTEELITAFPTDPLGVALVILAVCFAPALMEEFAFRGVVLGILRNVSEPLAIFVSGLLFGLMHGNFSQAPAASIMGFFFGFIAVKTRSIWPSVLLHFFNNGISVLMTYLSVFLNEDAVNAAYLLIFIFMLLAGIAGFILFVKNRPDAFALRAAEKTGRSGARRFWIFMGTPCMIIFTVLVLLEIIAAEMII